MVSMLTRTDLRGRTLGARELRAELPRADVDVDAAIEAVRPICADVQLRGAQALIDLAQRFDRVAPPHLRVPGDVLAAALDSLDPALRAALEVAVARIRAVHADQRRSDTTTAGRRGGTVTERWVPVDRVGLYVPGGLAVYPSSVVMNVVPAQLAEWAEPGRGEPTAARPRGWPHPTILAACALLGVDEVYAMGGAQAVAAFAYGSRTTVRSATRSASSPARATSTSPPPSACSRASSASTPRPAHRDRHPRRRQRRRRPRRGRPHQPGRARPARRSVLVTDSVALADAVEAGAGASGRRDQAHRAGRTALTGPQSAIVLVDDVEAASMSSTPMPPSTWRSRRRRGIRRRPGAQRRCGLRRSLVAGQPR
jgi:histidinol dehydrogenase